MLHLEVLDIQMRVLGRDHPGTLVTVNNLPLVYLNQGQLDKAVQLGQEALTTRERVLGKKHPAIWSLVSTLAIIYQDQGRLGEAITMLESVFEVALQILGANHVNTLSSMVHLGSAYINQGRLAEGVQLAEKVVAVPEAVLSSEHALRFKALGMLGTGCFLLGRPDCTINLHYSALFDCQRIFRPHQPHVLNLLSKLADELRGPVRFKEAAEAQERLVKGTQVTYSVDHRFTTEALAKLAELKNMLERESKSVD